MATNTYFSQGTTGEQDLTQSLVNEQIAMFGRNVYYIPDSLSLPAFIKKIISPDDIILIMGAGNIWRICENIYKEIK